MRTLLSVIMGVEGGGRKKHCGFLSLFGGLGNKRVLQVLLCIMSEEGGRINAKFWVGRNADANCFYLQAKKILHVGEKKLNFLKEHKLY